MKKNLEFTLAIDPGVNAMGFAVFPGCDLTRPSLEPPVYSGVVDADSLAKKLGPVNRIIALNRELKLRLDKYRGRIRLIVCEYPSIMRHGRGLAAANSGSVLHLATAVGTYAQASIEMAAMFLPIDVTAWKGNLPKEVVCARLQKAYGVDVLKAVLSSDYSHDWDAAGVGAFVRGMFK